MTCSCIRQDCQRQLSLERCKSNEIALISQTYGIYRFPSSFPIRITIDVWLRPILLAMYFMLFPS